MSTRRTQYTLSTLLAVLFLIGSTAPAQAQWGVAAGLNFESASDISTNRNATVESSTGYHAGVVYALSLGPLNLRPGFLYRKVGQTYQFPNNKADVSAWEVPVDIRVSLLTTPLVSPYVVGGPKASFYRSDLPDFDDDLESVSYSFVVGLGAQITLGSLPKLQPELRYDFGATDYVDETIEIGDTTFRQEDPRLSAFALRLNILF